jgi:hypothetical protein
MQDTTQKATKQVILILRVSQLLDGRNHGLYGVLELRIYFRVNPSRDQRIYFTAHDSTRCDTTPDVRT